MARPEDSKVKIPALVHFTRLGYEYMSLKKMVRGKDYDADTNIFYALFHEPINKINATEFSIDEVKKIVEELKIKLSKSIYVQRDFIQWQIMSFNQNVL